MADTVAPTLADRSGPVLYYQYGLHLAAAFVHTLTGISVAEALNGGWVVLVAAILPAGAAAIAWSLFPRRPWVGFWAATLAPGIVVFPLPDQRAAAVHGVPGHDPRLHGGHGQNSRGDARVPPFIPALSAVGIFVTHPTGAIVGAIVAVPLALEVILTTGSRHAALQVAGRTLRTAFLAGVAAMPWLLASGDRGPGASAAGPAVPSGHPGHRPSHSWPSQSR
jgi:hypothetical protein